jgi:hypothetical protein
MLLKDIADQIAGNFGKWDDLEFRRRCEDLVITANAELIRRDVNKYSVVPNNFLQQINCMPTVEVDIAECCSTTLGCMIRRTVDKVPNPVRIRNRNSNFVYVGTIDSKTSYSYLTSEEIENLSGERAFRNVVGYSYVNGYIYIHGSSPRNIRVKLIPSDPREVANLNDCDNPTQDCMDNIDVTGDMIRNVRVMVMDELRGSRVDPQSTEVELEDTNV